MKQLHRPGPRRRSAPVLALKVSLFPLLAPTPKYQL